MRKFWIMLLATGLIMAFSVPAFAVGGANINVTGSYVVRGLYASNPSLKDTDTAKSYSVFDQRLRMQPEFKIAEGLVLVTRFDVLERRWNGDRYGTFDTGYVATATRPAQIENQGNSNLSWERAYVDFTTGIGRFMVGYQNFTSWGTAIADGANSYPGIKYIVATGPFTFVAALEQTFEGQDGTIDTPTDSDGTAYDLGFIYKWTGGEAGLLYQYASSKENKTLGNFATKLHIIDPYVKATFGPVYVEAEGVWITGKAREYDTATKDIDAEALGIYAKVNVDLKPAYVGAIFAWVQGDDKLNTDTSQSDVKSFWLESLKAGSVFEPCLIFGSYWYAHAGLSQTGYANKGYTYFFDNIWFAQVYGGFKPIPKLDIFASFSWMERDKAPANYDKDLGYEVDVKATYQIFDNLSYMVGAGYFFTGDYFKGDKAAGNKIEDNYLLLHQLTLSF